jgi:hypothetical protein
MHKSQCNIHKLLLKKIFINQLNGLWRIVIVRVTMPFGMMMSCVICALTTEPLLLLYTSYIIEAAVTYERTQKERSVTVTITTSLLLIVQLLFHRQRNQPAAVVLLLQEGITLSMIVCNSIVFLSFFISYSTSTITQTNSNILKSSFQMLHLIIVIVFLSFSK